MLEISKEKRAVSFSATDDLSVSLNMRVGSRLTRIASIQRRDEFDHECVPGSDSTSSLGRFQVGRSLGV